MAEASTSQIEEIVANTDIEYMLEFETQLFLDIIHADGLVVAAKGLNLHLVIYNFLKVYCDPGNLVIVLNSTDSEVKWFTTKLGNKDVYNTTADTHTTERQDVYLSGGVHFVSTRILVVDMLKKRIPVEKITGFVVLRAHKIMESCQEAFVLRLFRQHNKTGFIKGFTNSVQSFVVGFGHVERVMRSLFVKELFIWPRFHSVVIKSLKPFEPKVLEFHIPISASMTKMQSYLLELMNLIIKEIKRVNKTVELQEITVENCLIKNYHKVLQSQLDVIWNQLSANTRQLVADLKTLRHLIIVMLYSDPVTFYSVLSSYRTKEYAQTATWVFLDPAEMLFSQANSILFTGDRELNPELCPKWKALLEILKVEIPHEIKKTTSKDNKILILCSSNKTCHQLNQLLTQGPHHYLFMAVLKNGISFKSLSESFKNCENISNKAEIPPIKKPKVDETTKNRPEDDPEEVFKNSYLLTMSQVAQIEEETEESGDGAYKFDSFLELENMDLTQICESLTAPAIVIQSFEGPEINLQLCLEELKPNFIVMYQSSIKATREIEMYEAHRKQEDRLKVYFLIHTGTVEEQSYLTSLRREKEAFEFLIQTKSTMVVPADQDGKSDLCNALQRDLKSPTKSTRQGGVEEISETRKFVIVDMREFRSELPALIHKRGVDIEPVTITVGDYILTPDICVERKSLSDLIGSLNSGRLYQQCTQMFRCYSKPMLLIEFDQNKPFSWQNQYMISGDANSFDIQKKLLLLTLHFPKLRIIWSPSPYATAQLFEELKDGKEEPNIEYASAIGSERDLDVIETRYNTSVYDFIQKLPGINSKNIDSFLRSTTSLDSAVRKSEDELKDILGNAVDAKAFHSILHQDHNPKDLEVENGKAKGKAKSRFKFTKKKS